MANDERPDYFAAAPSMRILYCAGSRVTFAAK
jgi:hypothetical protein